MGFYYTSRLNTSINTLYIYALLGVRFYTSDPYVITAPGWSTLAASCLCTRCFFQNCDFDAKLRDTLHKLPSSFITTSRDLSHLPDHDMRRASAEVESEYIIEHVKSFVILCQHEHLSEAQGLFSVIHNQEPCDTDQESAHIER